MPKIYVEIEVRRAEPYNEGRNWSVEYGPSTFYYSRNEFFDSFDALAEYLDATARRLALDSRLEKWPGLEVSAIPKTARKPAGWDKSRHQTAARVKIVGQVPA
jgi:hypothetical protein